MPRSTIAIALMLAASCAPQGERAAQTDLGATRAALDSTWADYVRVELRGDASGLGMFFTDSAVLISSGTPTIVGRDAIVAMLAGAFATGRYRQSEIVPDRTEEAGNRIFQSGTYRDDWQPTNGAPVINYGRFGLIARHDADGKWRIDRLVALVDSSVPASP